ncbi:collagen alpha-1(I) chain-like [Meles meles]|uniref:collagen alpha-1(I) chain-like n=1 Tax=Meles meles TaxID=9662 RepID=UPI001E69C2DD|nr:collagen alpha-1(I) chain-like [Meles meles]
MLARTRESGFTLDQTGTRRSAQPSGPVAGSVRGLGARGPWRGGRPAVSGVQGRPSGTGTRGHCETARPAGQTQAKPAPRPEPTRCPRGLGQGRGWALRPRVAASPAPAGAPTPRRPDTARRLPGGRPQRLPRACPRRRGAAVTSRGTRRSAPRGRRPPARPPRPRSRASAGPRAPHGPLRPRGGDSRGPGAAGSALPRLARRAPAPPAPPGAGPRPEPETRCARTHRVRRPSASPGACGSSAAVPGAAGPGRGLPWGRRPRPREAVHSPSARATPACGARGAPARTRCLGPTPGRGAETERGNGPRAAGGRRTAAAAGGGAGRGAAADPADPADPSRPPAAHSRRRPAGDAGVPRTAAATRRPRGADGARAGGLGGAGPRRTLPARPQAAGAPWPRLRRTRPDRAPGSRPHRRGFQGCGSRAADPARTAAAFPARAGHRPDCRCRDARRPAAGSGEPEPDPSIRPLRSSRGPLGTGGLTLRADQRGCVTCQDAQNLGLPPGDTAGLVVWSQAPTATELAGVTRWALQGSWTAAWKQLCQTTHPNPWTPARPFLLLSDRSRELRRGQEPSIYSTRHSSWVQEGLRLPGVVLWGQGVGPWHGLQGQPWSSEPIRCREASQLFQSLAPPNLGSHAHPGLSMGLGREGSAAQGGPVWPLGRPSGCPVGLGFTVPVLALASLLVVSAVLRSSNCGTQLLSTQHPVSRPRTGPWKLSATFHPGLPEPSQRSEETLAPSQHLRPRPSRRRGLF